MWYCTLKNKFLIGNTIARRSLKVRPLYSPSALLTGENDNHYSGNNSKGCVCTKDAMSGVSFYVKFISINALYKRQIFILTVVNIIIISKGFKRITCVGFHSGSHHSGCRRAQTIPWQLSSVDIHVFGYHPKAVLKMKAQHTPSNLCWYYKSKAFVLNWLLTPKPRRHTHTQAHKHAYWTKDGVTARQQTENSVLKNK